jgi:hypothetical protein
MLIVGFFFSYSILRKEYVVTEKEGINFIGKKNVK